VVVRAALAAFALAAAACTSISGTQPAADVPETPPSAVLAGAAAVDITPPPGFPMGGHSIAGSVGRGVWLRLYARCVYLEDDRGGRLALVSADLWGMPAGLADRVAELVHEAPDAKRIGRAELLIAATHTHHGPGNFSSAPAYNQLASCAGGFDRALFDFLARRIADGVLAAFRAREEARVGWGDWRAEGLFRNRSVPAIAQETTEASELMHKNVHLPWATPSADYPWPQASRLVDPSVRVLRIDRATGGTSIAAVAFAAVHPTTLAPDCPSYSAELFGAASADVETSLRGGVSFPDDAGPLVLFFNGAEGDVSASWTEQDRFETVRLGRKLADAALEAWRRAAPAASPTVEARFAAVPLASHEFPGDDGAPAVTSRDGLPGVSTLGGAEDGRTLLFGFSFREGVVARTSPARPGQGRKVPAFDELLKDVFGARRVDGATTYASRLLDPPAEAPLGVYLVAGRALASVPGEATTVTGRRIRRRLQDVLGASADDVVVVGLAHEYVSYFASFREYQAQHYEGASTLYGERSADEIVFELGALAATLRGAAPAGHDHRVALPRRYAYLPGSPASFGRRFLARAPEPLHLALLPIVQAEGRAPESVPRFSWTEPPGDLDASGPATPRVRVERIAGGVRTVVATDAGPDVAAAVDEADGDVAHWTAWWMPPPAPAPGRYEFVVRRTSGGPELRGEAEVVGP
jgi:neutral ceramidase